AGPIVGRAKDGRGMDRGRDQGSEVRFQQLAPVVGHPELPAHQGLGRRGPQRDHHLGTDLLNLGVHPRTPGPALRRPQLLVAPAASRRAGSLWSVGRNSVADRFGVAARAMEGNYPVEMGLIVPEGVELMTDVSAADWVVQALWPWRRPMPVGCIVPEGFEAYA